VAYTSDKDQLLCSKIDDAVTLSLTRQKPYYFSFMSQRRQAVADKYLKTICFDNYCFYGGYDASERKVLGLFYDKTDISDFPVSAIVFKFRKCDKLQHKDFLGALMSLGIERESVGDILVEDGRCVVFAKTELKDYITSQIFKVGNVGVTVEELNGDDLPKGRGQEELTFTVTSLRLDNIVAAICNLSREKTKNLILSGCVSVDFMQNQNVSQQLSQGCNLTIRGKGKFVFNAILGETKKGRIRISVIHYR
jgi:RNA-binding protein YlmH